MPNKYTKREAINRLNKIIDNLRDGVLVLELSRDVIEKTTSEGILGTRGDELDKVITEIEFKLSILSR